MNDDDDDHICLLCDPKHQLYPAKSSVKARLGNDCHGVGDIRLFRRDKGKQWSSRNSQEAAQLVSMLPSRAPFNYPVLRRENWQFSNYQEKTWCKNSLKYLLISLRRYLGWISQKRLFERRDQHKWTRSIILLFSYHFSTLLTIDSKHDEKTPDRWTVSKNGRFNFLVSSDGELLRDARESIAPYLNRFKDHLSQLPDRVL